MMKKRGKWGEKVKSKVRGGGEGGIPPQALHLTLISSCHQPSDVKIREGISCLVNERERLSGVNAGNEGGRSMKNEEFDLVEGLKGTERTAGLSPSRDRKANNIGALMSKDIRKSVGGREEGIVDSVEVARRVVFWPLERGGR